VWQVREGIREAMKQEPEIITKFNVALKIAANKTSVSKNEWIKNGNIINKIRQKTISDYV
jgi:hypothetical protein